jgi:hypothetical protein
VSTYYTIESYDENWNKIYSSITENLITNEGIMTLIKPLLQQNHATIDWKFRIGTGRKFTELTDTYNSLDEQDDIQILELDAGSEFYKKDTNVIVMNGIVLSNEGFINTVNYDINDQPEENTVTLGYKLDDIHQRFNNIGNLIGNDIYNKIDRKSFFEDTLKVAEHTLSDLKNNRLSDLHWLNHFNFSDYIKPVNIHIVDIGSWLNDIDETKKWNNISLIAKIGSERFLFSRTVLPPFLKCKGVRMVIKYTLII